MERRRSTREFTLEAVRLIRDRKVSYAQAAATPPSPGTEAIDFGRGEVGQRT
jgi:hypothetical protein